MPQKQCVWCGRLGPRYDERDAPIPVGEHDCVCRHVTCQTAKSARREHGRYWDGVRWVCVGCGTAPTHTQRRIFGRPRNRR